VIFVTVGTHEQQFDRLIGKIDQLKSEGILSEEIFLQTGYSSYIPQHCNFKSMIGFQEMDHYMDQAEIIITHGGPGSIMQALSKNKIPVVVPRLADFDEHVDNHQKYFTTRLEKEGKVLAVYDINHLDEILSNYHKLLKNLNIENDNNNEKFIEKMNNLTKEILS
jgi:UDP-N-acetylglucosamine transferase subunit ALG13